MLCQLDHSQYLSIREYSNSFKRVALTIRLIGIQLTDWVFNRLIGIRYLVSTDWYDRQID